MRSRGKLLAWASILSGLAQGRRPPTAQGGSPEGCKEKIDSLGSSDAMAVSSLISPTSGMILPILRRGKGTWKGRSSGASRV